MAAENWQLIAVTSPTAGCGKTLTAVNLAMRISRQLDKSALLVDLDLQPPQVAKTLGLRPDKVCWACSTDTSHCLTRSLGARIGNHHVSVLPCETSTSILPNGWLLREIGDLLQNIRKIIHHRSQLSTRRHPAAMTSYQSCRSSTVWFLSPCRRLTDVRYRTLHETSSVDPSGQGRSQQGSATHH